MTITVNNQVNVATGSEGGASISPPVPTIVEAEDGTSTTINTTFNLTVPDASSPKKGKTITDRAFTDLKKQVAGLVALVESLAARIDNTQVGDLKADLDGIVKALDESSKKSAEQVQETTKAIDSLSKTLASLATKIQGIPNELNATLKGLAPSLEQGLVSGLTRLSEQNEEILKRLSQPAPSSLTKKDLETVLGPLLEQIRLLQEQVKTLGEAKIHSTASEIDQIFKNVLGETKSNELKYGKLVPLIDGEAGFSIQRRMLEGKFIDSFEIIWKESKAADISNADAEVSIVLGPDGYSGLKEIIDASRTSEILGCERYSKLLLHGHLKTLKNLSGQGVYILNQNLFEGALIENINLGIGSFLELRGGPAQVRGLKAEGSTILLDKFQGTFHNSDFINCVLAGGVKDGVVSPELTPHFVLNADCKLTACDLTALDLRSSRVLYTKLDELSGLKGRLSGCLYRKSLMISELGDLGTVLELEKVSARQAEISGLVSLDSLIATGIELKKRLSNIEDLTVFSKELGITITGIFKDQAGISMQLILHAEPKIRYVYLLAENLTYGSAIGEQEKDDGKFCKISSVPLRQSVLVDIIQRARRRPDEEETKSATTNQTKLSEESTVLV